MSRIRGRTLVLVNWKGVFYERYSLDEHVTALEGDNGAGKTTVMIAAYVVLLPDMTRLRFTNVGESDATGGDKGIWGRLGNPNRPSYTVMAFDLSGEQILAGVHLERKGEPSVELTPFLISGLPKDVRLQDALLLRSDEEDLVPELSDLRENVARLGGRIQVLHTAKDYFAALFERGITPLRLVADEERTRFNDMLRTSMTGGISRALTSEFRSFLLKEESGLANTLARMRSNLDACRRTRTEVKEAQKLEQEISGVYEAGHEMFVAALLATRERERELRRRLDEAKQEREAALRERDMVIRDLGERIEERSQVADRLDITRQNHEASKTQLERVVRACEVAKRIAGLDDELRTVEIELNSAALAVNNASEVKARRASERDRAEEAYRLAAEGLADLQQGLEEFHRRADGYRTVMRRLADARVALEQPELAADDVDAHAETIGAAIQDIDARRSELDASIGTAEAHRADHAQAMQALTIILQREVASHCALEEARIALRNLSELDGIASRKQSLDEELDRARASFERQQQTQTKAAELSQPGEPLTSSHQVREALQLIDADVRGLTEQARAADSRTGELRHRWEQLEEEERTLRTRTNRWRELDTVASRLEAALGAGLRSAEDLDAAREVLDDERDHLQRELEGLESAYINAMERARALDQSGGEFHGDLLAARDILDGELLASHFEDVDPADAGRMQARLGPLIDAIVVDDTRAAAVALANHERELNTVWLVEEGGLHSLVAPNGTGGIDVGPTDVVVEHDGVVRTTRVPLTPTLGRKAREGLIAELNALTEDLSGKTSELVGQLEGINSRRRDTALLMREAATLELGDATLDLARVSADLGELRSQIDAQIAVADEAGKQVVRLSQRSEKLRDLLADAYLLDEPDYAGKVRELEELLQAAVLAHTELKRASQARRIVSERIDALRRSPPADNEIGEMRNEIEELLSQRERLFLAQDALSFVVAHREALGWSDAEDSLSTKQELVPALKAQCDNANSERKAATDAAQSAETVWEEARAAWRKIDDRRGALAASREQAQRELAEFGVDEPSTAAVERASEVSEQLRASSDELDRRERELGQTIAQLEERREVREKTLSEADELLVTVEREWKPAEDLWVRLRARAEANGLITPAITTRLLEAAHASVALWHNARNRASVLEERLRGAKGGDEILERIRGWLLAQEQSAGESLLQAWEVVRDWLRRRMPAQVTEVDDPLQALQRLRSHLKVLSDRLEDQERKLRGASADVARGIDVQIRTAQRQVRLLNRELEGVRFGTIRSMQVRLARDDRMEAVLRALREDTTQELLFAPTIPVEEALEDLFNRYGGRGPTVGQKLLDYREYVDIAVEVQRQASTTWERVNPSRLSTGEAIGVGTALMMVVLTAWERAANLFRAKRSLGTLRLLFLDEANRLSQDNLEVLFELCTVLELQLLIAAPEVANAPGCTTYRLVRRETPNGGEEVVVSGRRSMVEA